MAIPHPDPLQQEKLQKERRTRRTHVKVKTGCLTCKLRRKKCDETRPHCLRCTKTGRICDGYPQLPRRSSATSRKFSSSFSSCISKFSLQSSSEVETTTDCREPATLLLTDNLNSSLPMYRAPSAFTFSRDVDCHCFDFFRYNTGPQFEGFFDSSVWKSTALRVALSHPVALRAVTAVGAVHQRFNHDISREAFEYCAIADRLYREAGKAFVDYQKSDQKTPNFNEICMTISLLFALFEAFQGNFDKSVYHTISGLKSMWNRPFTVIHSESRYRRHEITPHVFTKLFRKMYTRATHLFGCPPKVTEYKPGVPLPPIPSRFWTLSEACDSIFTEAEWILHEPVELWHDESNRQEAQRLHIGRIFNWSVAYAEMVQNQGERTSKQKQAGLLLKTVRDATYLLLYIFFFVQPRSSSPPTSADSPIEPDEGCSSDEPKNLFIASNLLNSSISNRADLTTRFTRLCVLAEAHLNENSPFNYTSHSYSCDTAFGVYSTPAITPEASLKIRHILARLARAAYVEETDLSAWKVLSVYKLAERLASVEEHAVMAAAEDLIPKHLNARWVDITAFLEERRVLLRYCRPDASGDDSRGLIWVQEWIAF